MKRPGCRWGIPAVVHCGRAKADQIWLRLAYRRRRDLEGVRTSALATMPVSTTSRTAGAELPGVELWPPKVSVGGSVLTAVAPATLSSGSAWRPAWGRRGIRRRGRRCLRRRGRRCLRRRGRRRRFTGSSVQTMTWLMLLVAVLAARVVDGSRRWCPPRRSTPQRGCRRSCWRTRRTQTFTMTWSYVPSMSGSTYESPSPTSRVLAVVAPEVRLIGLVREGPHDP